MNYCIRPLLLLVASVLVCGCGPGRADVRRAQAEAKAARDEAEQLPKKFAELEKKLDEQKNKGAGDAKDSQTSMGNPPAATPAGGGSEQPAPRATNDAGPPVRRVSRSTPGTISVKLTAFSQPGETRAGGAWLYLNGQLLRDLSNRSFEYDGNLAVIKEELTLEPGNYQLEAVVAGCDSDVGRRETFVFQVQAQQVQIQPGSSTSQVFTFERIRQEPWFALHVGGYKGFEWDEWLAKWRAEIPMLRDRLKDDLLVEALIRANEALGDEPPARPVVKLDIPQAQGGAREVNAAQVRLLVWWLKWHYWGHWKRPATEYIGLAIRNDETTLRRITDEANRLTALVDETDKTLEQLNSLARKLDQARTQ